MEKMLSVINGTTNISLRIMDWFVTNYSKKHYTVYELEDSGTTPAKRFKVYVDYKLKLRAYSKKRFDPFCRWDRINVPHKNGTTYIQTTLGQLRRGHRARFQTKQAPTQRVIAHGQRDAGVIARGAGLD